MSELNHVGRRARAPFEVRLAAVQIDRDMLLLGLSPGTLQHIGDHVVRLVQNWCFLADHFQVGRIFRDQIRLAIEEPDSGQIAD